MQHSGTLEATYVVRNQDWNVRKEEALKKKKIMNNREAREKRDETAGIQGRRLSSAFDIPSLP